MIEPIGRAAAAYGLHRAPLAQPSPCLLYHYDAAAEEESGGLSRRGIM
ncbi:hypothetical protein [Azospirillum argentinense]|nr:hypothetical protein [Azospirillum argentinense]